MVSRIRRVPHRLGRKADDLIGIVEEIRDSPSTTPVIQKQAQARKPPLMHFLLPPKDKTLCVATQKA